MTESGLIENLGCETIKPFDREWERFNQSNLSPLELKALLSASCSILHWDHVLSKVEGFQIAFSFGRRDTLVALWVCTRWRSSYLLHGGISSMVQRLKSIMTDPLTASVYWPLARLGWDRRKRLV